MKNNPTQNNTPAENAKPAKKQWQKPDFYLLDRNEDVNNGVTFAFHENIQDVPAAHPASQYHS